MIKRLIYLILLIELPASATQWFVDSSVGSSGNGTSWATAWKTLANITTAVSPGDTVYISGGASGGSQSYTLSSFTPRGGTAGAYVTYQIGQDASHNGTATFSGGSLGFVGACQNFNWSGDAGDGKEHFSMSGYSSFVNCNPGPAQNVRWSYINWGIPTADEPYLTVNQQNVTIDHTFVQSASSTVNIIFHIASPRGGNAYGSAGTFSNNVIIAPGGSSGSPESGPDFIQTGGGGGFIIHDNVWISRQPLIHMDRSPQTNQHQDMLHCIQCSYVLFYNNVVMGSTVDETYLENTGTQSHLWVFNNAYIFAGGGIDDNIGTTSFEGVLNNTFIDLDSNLFGSPYRIHMQAIQTGSVYMNNLFYNCTGGDSINGSVTQAHNITAGAANYFANYSHDTTNTDAHLTSNASTAIGQGTNLTSLIAAYPELAPLGRDHDGNIRPSTGNWDIGAYIFTTNNMATNPPSVIQQPQSRTNAAGTLSTFSVTASGSGTLAYQWTTNGSAMAGASNSSVSFGSISTNLNGMTIFCTVTNAFGTNVSNTATQTVYQVPVIVLQPFGTTNGAGSTVSASVVAAGSSPLHYQWKTNAVSFFGTNSPQLTLANTTTGSSGGYFAVVTNVWGAVTSATAPILITNIPTGPPGTTNFWTNAIILNPTIE